MSVTEGAYISWGWSGQGSVQEVESVEVLTGQIQGFKAAEENVKVIKRRNGDSGKEKVSDEPVWEDTKFPLNCLW